jgi:hypothetical protein
MKSYSAIMRGAVLHKLGMDSVKERILRAHYGIPNDVIFRKGHHPTDRRYISVAGEDRCRGVMKWFANKV